MATLMKAGLAILALLAPFALALAQRWLIPSWYDASQSVAGVLFVAMLVAAARLGRGIARRADWRPWWRVAAGAGLAAVVVAAGVANFEASTREGIFLCGRELDATIDCGDGAQAFEFVHVCVGGNPRVEVAVRPNRLPLMYAVPGESGAEACAALRR